MKFPERKTIDFTEGSPLPEIIRFAIPVFIGFIFQQIYSLADRVVVGQFVGAEAFSAIGATGALLNLFMAVCIGFASGTGAVVSQYFGAKDKRKTASAITNGIYVCLAASVITTLVALILTRPLLILLGTPDSLMHDAVVYMMIYMSGMVAVAAYNAPFSIMQAMGDSNTPLYFLVLCSVLNIALDLIFVAVFGMGVAGAAIATVLSQLLAAVLCNMYAFRKIDGFKSAWIDRQFDSNMAGQIVKLSLPTTMQYALIYLSSVALQSVVNRFGDTAIGAFTATTQLEMLTQQFYLALANAMIAFTGQNIGAKKTGRITEGVKASARLSLIASLALIVFYWVCGGSVMQIFVDDVGITSLAASGIHITGSFFMAYGTAIIFRYMFLGAGDAGFTTLSGIVEIASRVGFGVLLTAIPAIGQMGIWWATALTWTVMALFAWMHYLRSKWKNKDLAK